MRLRALVLAAAALLGALACANASATPGQAVFALHPEHYDPALRVTESYFVAQAHAGASLTNAVRVVNTGTAARHRAPLPGRRDHRPDEWRRLPRPDEAEAGRRILGDARRELRHARSRQEHRRADHRGRPGDRAARRPPRRHRGRERRGDAGERQGRAADPGATPDDRRGRSSGARPGGCAGRSHRRACLRRARLPVRLPPLDQSGSADDEADRDCSSSRMRAATRSRRGASSSTRSCPGRRSTTRCCSRARRSPPASTGPTSRFGTAAAAIGYRRAAGPARTTRGSFAFVVSSKEYTAVFQGAPPSKVAAADRVARR